MGDNPFLLDDEEENEEVVPGSDNANFKQLRDYAKKLEKQVNSLSKERETLKNFKAEVEQREKVAAAAAVFTQLGLTDKNAALFFKVNPDEDVTPEAVKAFADEYGLAAAPAQSEPTEDGGGGTAAPDYTQEQILEIQHPGQKVGSPPAQQQGGGTPAATIITSVEDAEKLSVDNPTEYARMREAGRIKLAKLPGSD